MSKRTRSRSSRAQSHDFSHLRRPSSTRAGPLDVLFAAGLQRPRSDLQPAELAAEMLAVYERNLPAESRARQRTA